jgi:hypothetical protein
MGNVLAQVVIEQWWSMTVRWWLSEYQYSAQ